MSLIPTEAVLARLKREEIARAAGIAGLQGLIVQANAETAALLASIRAQTNLVREIRDEFEITVGQATARTNYLESVRISETAAIIERLDSISVSVGSSQSAALAAQASIDEYKVVAAAAGVAVAQQVTKLNSKVGDNRAAITVEATTRATEDEALASLITSLTATVGTNTAAITAEAITRATEDAALALAISTLSASAGVHTFVQASAPTALGTGDLWFDSDDNYKVYRWSGSAWVAVDDSRIVATQGTVTTLSSTVSTLSGTVSTLSTSVSSLTTSVATAQSTADGKNKTFIQASAPTATAVGDLWIDSDDSNKLYRWSGSSWDLAADSRITTNSADISTLQTTVTSHTGSLASLTTSVGVAQTTADAKVKTWIQGSAPTASAVGDIWVDTANGYALKRWDGSTWTDTTIAQGAIGVVSAAVTTEQSARIAADGSIHAKWGVNIDVNGRIAGRINLDGTNASSTFLVAVDKFVVENASGTITAMDIRTGGKIVFGADIQSDNFSAGTTGWRLERNSGNIEANNGTFRGTIVSSAGTIGGFTLGATSLSAGSGANAVELTSDVTGKPNNAALLLGSSGGYRSMAANHAYHVYSASQLNVVLGVGQGWTDNCGVLQLYTDAFASAQIEMHADTGEIFATGDGIFGGGLLVGTSNSTPGGGNTDVGCSVEDNGADGRTLWVSRGTNFCANFNRNADGTAVLLSRSGSVVGSISVTTTNTAFNTSSDRRIKAQVVDAPEVGDVIDSIQVREFEFLRLPGKKNLGFVAQELHAAFPDAVTPGDDGEEVRSVWGVDHSRLVPLLIKEVQSLRKRLAALEFFVLP